MSLPNKHATQLTIYYKRCFNNVGATLKSRSQIDNVFTTSILRRENYNVVPTVLQHWMISSPHIIIMDVVIAM